MIHELTNPVQPYPWGSRTVLAELLGEPSPSAGPQAELWLGAHPRGPSRVGDRSLADVVADAPERLLGDAAVTRFGPRLPFLLKVLAAEQPLSIQVHPSAEQARAGYAEEETRGVPADAPHRNYRDDWPKPELICALTEFEALCGFRDPAGSADLLDELVGLGAQALRPYVEALRTTADLGNVVGDLLAQPAANAASLVAEVARAAAAAPSGRPETRWAAELAAAYPGDPGVVVALLLNYVRLTPGQALYLPAGNMHAYLRGAGVELMASSDNVLRGGLTGKHVDVPELLRVLDGSPRAVEVLAAGEHDGEGVYETPCPYFRLSVVEPAGARVRLAGGRPQILLCVERSVGLVAAGEHVTLPAGRAAFVGADEAEVHVEGDGRLFRATTP